VIIVIIILLLVVAALLYILRRSLLLNRAYEVFFASTREDLYDIVSGINAVLEKKPLLTEDQDVRYLLRGIKLATEVLNTYVQTRDKLFGREEAK
jgi:hypothetical protein